MSNNTTKQFFNLHVSGIGYVNRIREVSVKKGSFWACSISALRGDSSDVEYTNFDCRISGEKAEKLIKRCRDAAQAKKKILIGFQIGDIYPETFVYEKGDKKGETGVNIKGRLLFISFIKIDGVEIYKAESKKTAEGTDNATPDQNQDQGEADIPEHDEAQSADDASQDQGTFDDEDKPF